MTLLCVIPTCRIRGRHLPACEDEKCLGCLPRQAENGYACDRCLSLAAQNLERVAEVSLAASDAADRLSAGSGGGATGKPGSQLPLDLGARSRLDSVTGTLNGWGRHVAEERGVRLHAPPAPVPPIGPLCPTRYGCTHASCKAMRDPERPPPKLTVVARWLAGHLDWLAHRPEVDEVFADFAACARVLGGVVRAPAEQTYLGPCGAEIEEPECNPIRHGPDCPEDCGTRKFCPGDIYGVRGARRGRCRTCGAEVAAEDRQAWLDGEVRAHAFRAAEIEEAYGIKANLIRQWATPARGLVQIHGHDREGRALYLLSHILDVAATQAAKRAEAQAKRARRTAAPATDERMSA